MRLSLKLKKKNEAEIFWGSMKEKENKKKKKGDRFCM